MSPAALAIIARLRGEVTGRFVRPRLPHLREPRAIGRHDWLRRVDAANDLAGEVGAKLDLEVLMLGGDTPKIGAPLVAGASVQCEIVEHGQGEKVIAFKKTHRKRGHRQHFTTVKVLGISAGKE